MKILFRRWAATLSTTPHALTSSPWQMFAKIPTHAIASHRSTQLERAYMEPANLVTGSGTPTSQALPTGLKPKCTAASFALD